MARRRQMTDIPTPSSKGPLPLSTSSLISTPAESLKTDCRHPGAMRSCHSVLQPQKVPGSIESEQLVQYPLQASWKDLLPRSVRRPYRCHLFKGSRVKIKAFSRCQPQRGSTIVGFPGSRAKSARTSWDVAKRHLERLSQCSIAPPVVAADAAREHINDINLQAEARHL